MKARIDSLLAIVVQQAANELRVGTDKEPKMLAHGVAKRLAVPATSEDVLRGLLGEILSPESEEAMRSSGRAEVLYNADALGAFRVTLAARADGGFDAVFMRDSGRAKTGVAERSSTAPRVLPLPTIEAVPVHEASVTELAPSEHVAANHELTSSFFELISHAARMRASDIHFADGEPISLRIDGELLRIDDSARMNIAETVALDASALARIHHGDSLDLAFAVPNVGRVRAHVYRADGRLAMAVRLLPALAPTLASLRMPVPIDDIVDIPQGLVLLCGATGSGKSTTLAAIAQEALRRRSVVLTTLEDPIEYELIAPSTSIVRRRQIGRDVRDFGSGLRDALREDPDILIVGEMRDRETISLALTAAETGHLVLSSLHARSAASAIERIVDSYPAERQQQIRVQLADALQVIVAQRLVPSASGNGRVLVAEVLRVTHAVSNMIREGKTAQIASALQSGRSEGMISLDRCLADKVHAGEITLTAARAIANDPTSLESFRK